MDNLIITYVAMIRGENREVILTGAAFDSFGQMLAVLPIMGDSVIFEEGGKSYVIHSRTRCHDAAWKLGIYMDEQEALELQAKLLG